MKVVVDGICALNPSVIRVSVYTYTDDPEANDCKSYELAIPIEDFTEITDGNVGIDGDKFQQVVSERIIKAQLTANLALYMDNLNLEWELNTQVPETREEASVEGLKLAYGQE